MRTPPQDLALAAVCACALVAPGAAHAAQGGPDAYGYTWADSCEAGVSYNYELSNNSVAMADDDYVTVSLGFTFDFYGVAYTSITLTSNGMAHFDGSTYITYSNQSLPYSSYQIIAPFWDDLNPANGGAVYYGTSGSWPNRVFIAEWWGVPRYPDYDALYFELKLYESDQSIEFHYLDTDVGVVSYDAGASATVGIADGAQGYGLERSYNDAVIPSSYAIRFEPPSCFDSDGDGYLDQACGGTDCDDGDAGTYPGAVEVCDGDDNDCDGTTDEQNASGCTTWYYDSDNDDYGLTGSSQCWCQASGIYRGTYSGDCDDTNAAIYPGASEWCNSVDDDCDGSVDEAGSLGCTSYYYDADDDGYGVTTDSECHCSEYGLYRATAWGDCDDSDPSISPAASEVCNGVDDDCDGSPEWDEADSDGDSYMMCQGDCEDAAADVYPGAPQVCDGYDDNNCDGVDDSNEVDDDGDGYSVCDGDCDDTEPWSAPGLTENCDGLDNDCNGAVDDVDDDGDGQLDSWCGGMDCDDHDATTYPGAPELCDEVDNDCDGIVPADETTDDDGDGYLACEDCDDAEYAVYPGAAEVCDGLDSDCDGEIPEDEDDLDGDGEFPCSGDCDDLDDTIFPGAPELCDGLDNDCDPATSEHVDNDGDGISGCEGDCDDAHAEANPGGIEICDGLDNDCNGGVDDLGDGDGDGFHYCDDCDDADSGIHPDAVEVCDGVDNDCDEVSDDVDADEDGHVDTACGGGDCDDGDPSIHPDASEQCEDGVDNDCDGFADREDDECEDVGDDDDSAEVPGDDDDTLSPADDDGPTDPTWGVCECRTAAPDAAVPSGAWAALVALILLMLRRGRRR